jgi:nudix-type nucleoside diphosphatase (YffH/AdpP family)
MGLVTVTGAVGMQAIVLGADAAPERVRFYAETLQIEPVTDGTRHRFDLGPGGPEAEALAELVMQAHGAFSAAEVRRRLGSLRVLAASRVRAMTHAPSRLRVGTGDFAVTERRQPHAGFLALEVLTLSHARFDGTTSPPIIREVMLSGDAVTVLPYDPVRDRVLLIEQMRVGPLGRGDPLPWQLEAIAGRIDPGETPEDAARREAVEEAGLNLGKLHKVAEYYPTPGVMAEYLYSFVALCDLPDDVAGVFGAADEAEDIRGLVLSLDALLEAMSDGEITNAPLLLTALWLQRERDRLRG